ncbi:hypothetical protein DB41_FX00020 [Neochlamydia sp. TUME1]|uniref:DNA-directed RNA polymerase subunit alpha C-terminal domain-containing protein n=1 Tax=Neochlamydia sp. TUME1 TaxID=1478174 RepID=UPI000582EDF9|nr:DNA-directed RNA polymerase subunit alpha C-terminal domain-containing protein [Neochlamydia sp. TUME1]KIC76493.1 hypothetical protein DB41_FX00020 [Neochlamydia sp. TUME1]
MAVLEFKQETNLSPSKGHRKRSTEPSSTTLLSFEETYKTSYSHGLENIYALENVDINSIRRIGTLSPTAPPPLKNKKELFTGEEDELDLGEEFRGWIPSFIPKVPIQVLELSKYIEKALLENGKKTIGDLTKASIDDFVFLRGIGQGHLEEINRKLNSYLESRSLGKCKKVDFLAWLQSLVATQERKKAYALLEPYNLTELFVLSPSEKVELRQLSLEKKQEWIQEVVNKMATPLQKQRVLEDMQLIFNVFFKPWIRRRGGIATRHELIERMQRISANKAMGISVVNFLQTHFFDSKDCLSLFLQEIEEEIYACDHHSIQEYGEIISKALSYFYKPSIYYRLTELITWVEKELAKAWIGYHEGYVEKIIRLSPTFDIVRGASGQLEVYCRKYFSITNLF